MRSSCRPGLLSVVLVLLALLASNPAEALLAPLLPLPPRRPSPPPPPPPPLWYGVATSSYQIEGGAREGGRGVSIWDTFSKNAGDVADDFYHRFADDIRLAGELGVQKFRLSISWPRIFPNRTLSDDGVLEKPNEEGFEFYERVLDRLLEEGIEPLVTLYHWVSGRRRGSSSFLLFCCRFLTQRERKREREKERERDEGKTREREGKKNSLCEIPFPKKKKTRTQHKQTGPPSSSAGQLRRLDFPQNR